MEIATLSNFFKAMGDPLRLRLLHLLSTEELTVGELVRILDLPQSTISRHLKTLRESGLVSDRPLGSATYYCAAIEAEGGNGDTLLRDALGALLRDSSLSPTDLQRLERVVALREGEGSEFFDKVGRRWDALRTDCFGPSFHLEALMHLLPPEWVVADLGTGTGYLLPALGRHFRQVIGVDQSEPMLALAKQSLAEGARGNIDLRHGRLEELPIAADTVDLAVALLMLHHLPSVESALHEVGRILKPHGRLLIVELHPYQNERFRIAMADRRSGIDPRALAQALVQAGFPQTECWDLPTIGHPEHELAPLPRLYGIIGQRKGK